MSSESRRSISNRAPAVRTVSASPPGICSAVASVCGSPMAKITYGDPRRSPEISTPVQSVWANPRVLSPDRRTLVPLAKVLGKDPDHLRQLLARRSDRSFVYLKRRVTPDTAERLERLLQAKEINGIGLQREYRRYYPGAEVFAHVLGFTDIDDQGQEGLELAFDHWMKGTAGRNSVRKAPSPFSSR